MRKLAVQLLVALAILCSHATVSTVRLQLTHIDAGRGFTRRDMLHRMVLRSKARAARLLSGSRVSAPVNPARFSDAVPVAEYLARFSIGTPPQLVQLEVDTGSDLTWTQCVPCVACFDQLLPHFDPSLSSTLGAFSCRSAACQDLPVASCGTEKFWGNQTCVYTYAYGDRSVTTGHLYSDTFTFAGAGERVGVPDLAFGCGFFNNGLFMFNETGIAGFGRGTLSLLSQLKVDNFSHCFTTITGSAPSTVLLGLPANLHSGARGEIQTTPFVKNPADFPTFYYHSLTGITVGSSRLPVPEYAFAVTTQGTGGTIIDSGTAFTMLPPEVYRHLHDAFASQMSLPVTNDDPLCFAAAPGEKPDLPKLALHFEGATLDLPRENYVFEYEEAPGRSHACLAILEGGDMTILGNYQQQNMHVLYDLANNMLSFVPAQCDMV